MKIKLSRWPWQESTPGKRWGWFPHKNGTGVRAMLNPAGSRFGGGWNYKIGVSVGGRTAIVDLLFGSVRIELRGPKP